MNIQPLRFVIVAALLASEPVLAAPTAEQLDFVEKRVRPLLLSRCGNCHGPKKQQGGLRLDSGEAIRKGGDSGAVLRPGHPEGSLLIEAVRRTGMLKMPPKDSLQPDQVAVLEAWIKMGAPWPSPAPTIDEVARTEAWKRHWAFQPVRKPALPPVKNADWARTAIDRFILAKLEEKGLSPSPMADKRTLLRRLSFDLIGLPPTAEEVAAFLDDKNPDAYERQVERLLASPHYGERWGRHWLDVARYADTKGYVFFEQQTYPWAWTYRDYVIEAFNNDLPYDQFILHQLAADQVTSDDKRPLRAMGYLTLGDHFMSNPYDIVDDRIDVVTRGLLGLTVGCARCHDHKFDPIPTRDYYSLYGVLGSSVEPDDPPLFAAPPPTPAYEAFRKELTTREKKLSDFVRSKQNEVIAAARSRVAEYLLAAHAMKDQPASDDFMLIADGGDVNPTMLTRWRAYLRRTVKAPHPVWSLWHALAALPEMDFAARARQLIETPPPGTNPLLLKSFRDKPLANLKEAAGRVGEVLNAAHTEWQRLLKSAADAKRPPPAGLPDPAQDALRKVWLEPDAPPNVNLALFSDLALLPDRASQGVYQNLRKAVEDYRATGPGAPPRAHVLVDAAVLHEPHVFLRGNPNTLGEAVPRQYLSVLAGPNRKPFKQGSGRLELAQAIADRHNPLAARVLVNRVWHWHFGQGLVRTPSDFGLRSDPPSHPELLDYLATSFVEQGWSIKKLHRMIVLSAVYQQESLDRAEGRRVDPDNRLHWKMNRGRLDFEAMRDALLAVSSRLDHTVGGPSVDVLAPTSRRRTMYGFLDRLKVPGLYRTFDFPSPDATSPQRDATTIPQQALFLLNNPFLLECARSLLARPEVAGEKAPEAKVERIYRLAFGRPPHPEETVLAVGFLTGASDSSTAWQRYVQALLLANEFAFVD